MKSEDHVKNEQGLRVIKTARTEKAINQAAQKGFFPVVRRVKPSKEIHSKFCVWQNRETGEIAVLGDYRMGARAKPWEQVIKWSDYYPYSFPEPYAAYLIPPDIQVGEQVFVEDLIEDFIGLSWGQGDNYRLKSCTARWDGEDLKIEYDPDQHMELAIG